MSVKTVTTLINGQSYTLSYNQTSGKYEATVTAPSKSSYTKEGHYYGVQVKATDEAGNTTTKDHTDSTLGESLQLIVKEKVAPVITIISPTSSALITNNKPVIEWKVTDDDSGVASSTISVTIDGNKITQGITKTPISGGYQCSYTPATALNDGEHTIAFDAYDNDGNKATQKSVTFTIDTVPPTLSITNPAEGYITNKSSLIVSGKTNDATSSPVTVTVNGQSVTVNADGTFSKSITLTNGSNTITVVATDSAGKKTTVVRYVTLDTGAPVIQAVTLTPNPVDAGKTFIISVEVTD